MKIRTAIIPRHYVIKVVIVAASLASVCFLSAQSAVSKELPANARRLITKHCLECHQERDSESRLNIDALISRQLDPEVVSSWIKIYERVESGEMPPDDSLSTHERRLLLEELYPSLVKIEKEQIKSQGRTVLRRMNRFEFENSLRDLLHAPWLQIKNMLPEDGEMERFNKVSEALDISHVNLSRTMQAVDYALREVVAKDQTLYTPSVTRYYAREQPGFNRKVHFTVFNRSPERATFPLIGYQADTKVLSDEKQPFTVGASDPQLREQESFGVVASSYEPIEPQFNNFGAPVSGRFKLRFKGYTFWAEGEEKRWWKPSREKISIGRRSEPIAIYAEIPPRQLRKLGEFDFQIEPTVQELDVYLLQGETIQPDAVRLFRSRPPNFHNPLAEKEGMPGVAFSYLEVEGPIVDDWPIAGHRILFDDLPLREREGRIEIISEQPEEDAKRLLRRFLNKAYSTHPSEEHFDSLIRIFRSASEAGHSFRESIIAMYTGALCSPQYIGFLEPNGPLDSKSVASRLSSFLWNTPSAEDLRDLADSGQLTKPDKLREVARRMLEDKRAERFIETFLAYWLDLRKIYDTSPDEFLYPDYYLDDSLLDAAVLETQLFFRETILKDLPARTLVDADFTFVNERLAQHYGFPHFEGVALRRVPVPKESPRGGLLTQASLLKVTANGTTTSPVVRGAWINERILGNRVPLPPKSVPAIEPDTRGATTIRQQLELHRSDPSCAGCHSKMDPIGFALENFDVVGGWRDRYRSFGETGEQVEGFGKNGQPFTFRLGPAVDSSGILESGNSFTDIASLKKLLVANERQIARNLLKQLMIYATGSVPRFSDRDEMERILDLLEPSGYPVGSMIEEIVCSPLFLNK
jgi:hypothetical protein